MNDKDAAVIKTLAELGLHKEPSLTREQEKWFKRAVDPEEEFLHQVQQIFKITEEDQWLNQDTSLSHFDKKQKAATFEFWKFLTEINNKYKLGMSTTSAARSLSFESSVSSVGWSLSHLSALLVSYLSQAEKDKYQKLFDRMVSAKKKFEDAMGRDIK